jgi:SRSO17 transposase
MSVKGGSSVTSKKPKKDWAAQLQQWAAPFLGALAHPAQRRWAPVYLTGLLGPGERKSPMALAEQVAPEDGWQLHPFVSASPWPTEQLEVVLVQKAQELVGGPGSHLIIDDTALLKQGRGSVRVAHLSLPKTSSSLLRLAVSLISLYTRPTEHTPCPEAKCLSARSFLSSFVV